MAHYAAAKVGVIGFTRSLAYEVAEHDLTVNAIAPGPIDTERFRNPEFQRRRRNGLTAEETISGVTQLTFQDRVGISIAIEY
jgi:NAD(P)-dependent dehydrogenase (short-subunit alcohol dehydrogenase family)